MRSAVFAAIAAATFVGCAQPPLRQANYRPPTADELRVPYTQPVTPKRTVLVPTCKGSLECAQKWVTAQDTLQTVTMMRLRLVTDSRLETFAALRPPMLTGSVIKYPIGQEEFELRVDLECSRDMRPCDDLRQAAVNAFNSLLGGKIVEATQ